MVRPTSMVRPQNKAAREVHIGMKKKKRYSPLVRCHSCTSLHELLFVSLVSSSIPFELDLPRVWLDLPRVRLDLLVWLD